MHASSREETETIVNTVDSQRATAATHRSIRLLLHDEAAYKSTAASVPAMHRADGFSTAR